MTSIEQDPENKAEEFAPQSPETAEEHRVESSVDPLVAEANPADVAEQEAEAPAATPLVTTDQTDDTLKNPADDA